MFSCLGRTTSSILNFSLLRNINAKLVTTHVKSLTGLDLYSYCRFANNYRGLAARSKSFDFVKTNIHSSRVNISRTTLNFRMGSTSSETVPATLLSGIEGQKLTSLLGNIDAVMFDCDGVLWRGMDPFKNAQQLVIKLRSLGKKVFFITNNSNRTRAEFLEKFNKLGFEATVEEIVGTAYLTALYLQELKFNKMVYLVGPLGVVHELQAVGVQCLPIGPDVCDPTNERWNQSDFDNIELDPNVGAVVVGFDHHFSYKKVLKAASYLKNEKCLFIATNTDEQFPGAKELIYPGTGTFVNAVKTAAGREPVIMGKPEPFPYELVSRQHNLKPERVLMVGDRGNTDILFGKRCGLQTLLVLTGVTDLETMHRWEKSEDPTEKLCVPDYYLKDVDEFYQLLAAKKA